MNPRLILHFVHYTDQLKIINRFATPNLFDERVNMTPFSARAAPFVRLARRLFAGPGSPESIAAEIEVLCAAEVQEVALPVYLPGHLDLVVAATEHQPLKFEIESMLNTSAHHAGTKAYHVKDAVIHNGSVYAKNMRFFLEERSTEPVGDYAHYQSASLASTATGCRYFGHWLRDDCTQYLLGNNRGPTLTMASHMTAHQMEYADLFSQDWTCTASATVDHLVIFQDFAQNSSKRARYQELAARVSKVIPDEPRKDLIFLRRGETGAARLIENEAALLDQLVRNNFEIVDVTPDLGNILPKLKRARLVVSMEGSQISHCAYTLTEGCALLVLQPCDRFTSAHRLWTAGQGIKFGFLVGRKGAHGYRFSSSDVLTVADQLLE